MNAKDLQIDTWRKEAEAEYEQWLDSLDLQQEQQARLVEQGHVPSPIGGYHAEV
jgi:heme oxygenase